MSTPERSGSVEAVRAAAQRLAQRLRFREATTASVASPAVPRWWREGLAGVAIFGDGLLSLPAAGDDTFSRPVTLLDAAEISTSAGGEYVPLAWVSGGTAIALVHDRGALPVVLVTPGQGGSRAPAEPVAESLVEFLDALAPQTVCRFVGRGEQWSVELCGVSSLLVERGGEVGRREFASAEEMGGFVASFVVAALETGMGVAFCPARLRALVERHGGTVTAPALLPEVRAQGAIRRLLADELLELTGEIDVEVLIEDAGRYLDRHAGVAPHALARQFADWLTSHPAVDELYADDDTMGRALAAVAS